MPGDAVVAEGEYRGGGGRRRRTVVLSRPLPGRGQGEGERVPSFGSTDSQRGLTSTRGEMAPSALRSSVVAGEPQPMCTTSRVDGARKSSACQSVRLIEQAESDEASETASGAGARPAKRGGGAAQASARAKACMLESSVRQALAQPSTQATQLQQVISCAPLENYLVGAQLVSWKLETTTVPGQP